MSVRALACTRARGTLPLWGASLLLVACRAPVEPGTGRPASLTVEPDALVLEQREEARLRAVVRDAGGRELPHAKVLWRSSDSLVVPVDQDGAVRARGLGEARVSAHHGPLADAAPVTVVPAGPLVLFLTPG